MGTWKIVFFQVVPTEYLLTITSQIMPNTLAHIGVQTLVTKSICRTADFKWIAVGCILPDIPWIMQRAVLGLIPGIDASGLHLYATIQSSLFYSLILAGAVSLLARESRKIFLILAGNCLLHLLLDALQIKWGNGVLLLAPFSWQLTGFHLFWPEQLPTSLMTGLGLIVLILFSIKDGLTPVYFKISPDRLIPAALVLGLYFLTPPLFFQGPLSADNHFAATILDRTHRSGHRVAFDRSRYDPATRTIRIFSGERLKVTGLPDLKSGTVSLQGIFTDANTVQALQWHVHSPLRNINSLVGLGATLLVWMVALFKKRCRVSPSTASAARTDLKK